MICSSCLSLHRERASCERARPRGRMRKGYVQFRPTMTPHGGECSSPVNRQASCGQRVSGCSAARTAPATSLILLQRMPIFLFGYNGGSCRSSL
jgi:hypothetical protein